MKKLIGIVIVLMIEIGLLHAQSNDFVQAFDSMHQTFSVNYPMGKWKGIDWEALNNTIRPKIVNAEIANDSIAFYIALQEYASSIHDGHVNIRHGWANIRSEARYRQIGGSYGFVVAGLDDDRIVARLVNEGSPAALAGMKFGAEILEVNDNPVHAVLDTISVHWAELIPATQEFKRLNQYRFLGRAPVGNTLKVKFLNRGASLPVTATLTAVDDNYATYDQTTQSPAESIEGITTDVLAGGYGYIKLNTVYGDSAGIKMIYTDFRDAIIGFNENDAPGLILDMRINTGGYDALAAALAGFFYSDTTFYESQSWYNPDCDSLQMWPLPLEHWNPQTLQFQINPNYPVGTLYTEPQGVLFSKPVMVLVGPRNISSGEGIPMMLQKLPNCKSVGFHSTNGSFAMVERTHYFFPSPDDLYLRYPYGVSYDQNHSIQLDSDSAMIGGVSPDIRVPLNDVVIDLLYIDSMDVELNYALEMLHSITGIETNFIGNNNVILEQNYPNPFSIYTSISYELPDEMFVKLTVYDIYGRNVATLIHSMQEAGSHSVQFNATGIKPGIYFYQLSAGDNVMTKKCLIK